MYADKVFKHFMRPQNSCIMPYADAEGSYGDPACGDYLEMYIKADNNIITEISCMIFGSPASIAVSSMTSVPVKVKVWKKP
jgi:nitrogen fixation NifU-like protein